MQPADQNPIAKAIIAALSFIYDQVAVSTRSVLSATRHYDEEYEDWTDYQQRAGFRMMDEIADGHIKACKVQVSGLGAVAGFGGYAALVPDAIQFVTLTLRMVTGIAAAYGFDPAPTYLEGKTKVIVLQAYLNANLGQAGYKGAEKIGLSAITKFLKNVAMRSNLLMKIIVAIGRVIGIRITRAWLLKSVPFVASGVNAGFNWYLAGQIGREAKREFRQFREDLRDGKYRDDDDYDGL